MEVRSRSRSRRESRAGVSPAQPRRQARRSHHQGLASLGRAGETPALRWWYGQDAPVPEARGPTALDRATPVQSHRVFGHDPIRYHFRPAGLKTNHGVIKPAVAAQLAGRLAEDLEAHLHVRAPDLVHPGPHQARVTQKERAFVFDV